MSEQTGGAQGITCPETIDITALLKPLFMKAALQPEGEVPLDAIVTIIINDKIEKQLLASVQLPEEFADLADAICLMVEMDKLKALTAIMRGEAPPETTALDKVLNLIVQLQMLKALEGAFQTGGSTGSQA